MRSLQNLGKNFSIPSQFWQNSHMEDRAFQLAIITETGTPLNFSEADDAAIQGAFEAAVYELLWRQRERDAVDHRAIATQILKWSGLNIGIEYPIGSIRFPGANAHKMRSAYGHIQGFRINGKAPDVYLAPEVLDGGGTDKLFQVVQTDGQTKLMAGYSDLDAAQNAYLAEVPAKFFESIKPVSLDFLNKYRLGLPDSPSHKEGSIPGARIQSLLFSAEKYTQAEAIAWAKKRGFKAAGVDAANNHHRVRQYAARDGEEYRVVTLDRAKKIKAVVGLVATSPHSIDPSASLRVNGDVAFSEADKGNVSDPEAISEIKGLLIQEIGRINSIVKLDFDGDSIFTGIAEQRLNLKKSQYISFTINADSGAMNYKIVSAPSFSEDDWLEALNLADTVDFAGKNLNCKPGNVQCGGKCQAGTLNCFHGMTPAQKKAAQSAAKKAKAAALKASAKPAQSAPTTAPAPTPVSPPSPSPQTPASKLQVNQPELDNTRAALVNKWGQRLVTSSEKNTQKILNSDDTQVFIRVGSSDTLEKILGNRFLTSGELGIDAHQIPNLKGGYQAARNRVEEKTLGYALNTAPGDRPIYGYLASNDLNGASHADVAQAYGSIAVKLKSEVKDRATFTGCDSFKSGIASDVATKGTPPPPNAASLASTTRHGYDLANLPSHYPSFMQSDSDQKRQLNLASKAKDINDLAALAPTGNRYVEAQIHGQVKPEDIAELHFTSGGAQPTAAIATWAKKNGTKIYIGGKEADLDAIINPPAVKSSRTKDMSDAIDSGDFEKVTAIAQDIHASAKQIKTPGDNYLAAIYKEAGYDGLPKVVSEQDVTNEYKNGGTLMVRGVGNIPGGKTAQQCLDEFKQGDYFAGLGIYGNGTYVSHAGPPPSKKNAQAALAAVTSNKYITPQTANFRMSLAPDAKIIKQSDFAKEVSDVKSKFQNWADTQESKLNSALVIASRQVSLPAIKAEANRITKDYKANYTASMLPLTFRLNHPAYNPAINSRSGGAYQKELVLSDKKTNKPIATKYLVQYSPGLGLKRPYSVFDPEGNLIAVRKTEVEAQAEALKAHIENTAKTNLANKASNGVSVAKAQQDLYDFQEKARIAKEVLFGDEGGGSSGRLATIRGYDAIALDQSYEPKHFMVLLNRTKVSIQKEPFDYATAKQKVAGFNVIAKIGKASLSFDEAN